MKLHSQPPPPPLAGFSAAPPGHLVTGALHAKSVRPVTVRAFVFGSSVWIQLYSRKRKHPALPRVVTWHVIRMTAATHDEGDLGAVSGTLTSHCTRVLRDTRNPDAAIFAFSAMLALVDSAHEPVPPPTESEECNNLAHIVKETLHTQPRTALSDAFLRHHYARWAATLLDAGFVNWHGTLTDGAAKALFDSHLLCAPPREALQALVTALGAPSAHAHAYRRAEERRAATLERSSSSRCCVRAACALCCLPSRSSSPPPIVSGSRIKLRHGRPWARCVAGRAAAKRWKLQHLFSGTPGHRR